jgi:hypothetical protein
MNTPKTFANAIAQMSMPGVFNPYHDCCPVHDRVDAARVRKHNLVLCLEAALDSKVETIWIARDLGYRGGRRTGVPLTDEVHLSAAASMFGIASLGRATRGPLIAERTAAVVWGLLSQIGQPAFLWNVFPLHPHEPGDPMSNRCHTRAEREATWPLLESLIAMLKPKRIVAIGKDAGAALADLAVPVSMVRHPSYGGQAEFVAGICDLYCVANPARDQPSLPHFADVYAGSRAVSA